MNTNGKICPRNEMCKKKNAESQSSEIFYN